MSELFTAPWYPWYVTDVLTSERVELMSLAEEGAYRRALDRAWKKGSIPADPVQCARAIGKRCPVSVAKTVLQMFQPVPDDPTRMVNDTLERVREEQRQKYLSTSKKGKAGAEKRWHSHSPAKAQPMPKQWQSESDTERDSEQEEEKKMKKRPAPSEPVTKGWVNSLVKTPAYKNLSVLKEVDKAKIWADANNRDFDRPFVVAWLNRCYPEKADVGKHNGEPEPHFDCNRCLDTGEATQKPRHAKYDWELESIPCPDCKVKVAA